MKDTVFSVSQINNQIKKLLEAQPFLNGIYVRGELSNYKIYPSGHHYFSIKDEGCALKCVMFRTNASGLRFRPENGMQVTILGNISVYPRDGVYQLYCTNMIPEGAGDLSLAFEQLKAKLEAEGLFSYSHKKPLPSFPSRIALVTSGSGAAVHDMLRILKSRWPLSSVLVVPVAVQGASAAAEISSAIRYVNSNSLADLIITGRGGGSTEDLWCFNEEQLARAIYDSVIPVISAVGHEPDVTISDYVADRRASTPSNAAEIAVQSSEDMKLRLSSSSSRLSSAMSSALNKYKSDIERIASFPSIKDPLYRLQLMRQDLDHFSEISDNTIHSSLNDLRARLSAVHGIVKGSGPIQTLTRGYSLALKDGKTVNSVSQLSAGDGLVLQLLDGQAACVVNNISAGAII